MKTLSIKQPYAELILLGKKKIELRKWNTKFRGDFLIHASKNPDEKAMKQFNFKDLASSYWGDYGFILKDPKRIKEIPCKGSLGFWEFNLSSQYPHAFH